MSWNKGIRQFHRWTSIAFTVAVIANFVAIGMGKPVPWLYYVPLLPLALLLITGLYMFVLPYVSKAHSEQGTRLRGTVME